MSKLAKALTAAAGNAAGESLYVEDVFSTYLYTGNGSTQSIDNGIDLDGEGGLTWIKCRNVAFDHALYDTSRGATKQLKSNSTSAETTNTDSLTAFNSDGFSLDDDPLINDNTQDYASWTFRKAEKFFDVVTYTGDGVTGRAVSHNLGVAPAVIIVKNLSTSNRAWQVYHSSLGITKRLELDSTGAAANSSHWTYEPTSTEFYLRNLGVLNGSGENYVAYLFASDAGGFGDDGSENIIKCGSYVGSGASGKTVDFGFEPQWVLIKNTNSGTKSWHISDMMRGLNYSTDYTLSPNTSSAETNWGVVKPTATGVLFTDGDDNFNSTDTFIYIAIRRPMKTPESGTEVFAPISLGTTTEPGFVSGFVTDFSIHRTVNETGSRQVSSRMTGNKYMFSDATNAEGSISAIQWDFMDGSRVGNGTANANEIQWMFKRATGFFDVVAYTGNGVAGRTVAHNLGAAPELMIVKVRDSSTWGWVVYAKPAGTGHLQLNNTQDYTASDYFNYTNPTDSVFYVSDQARTNLSGGSLIAYLFATLAGVSKVGSYTGTGSNVDVDCGFSAGARFILIKRTDSSGDWYVYDSLRGIVAGNDPYLLLNTTAAEVTSTDYIDPLASGFTVTSSAPAALNASGGNYIFLAIA